VWNLSITQNHTWFVQTPTRTATKTYVEPVACCSNKVYRGEAGHHKPAFSKKLGRSWVIGFTPHPENEQKRAVSAMETSLIFLRVHQRLTDQLALCWWWIDKDHCQDHERLSSPRYSQTTVESMMFLVNELLNFRACCSAAWYRESILLPP
jgi:hypothetical protein